MKRLVQQKVAELAKSVIEFPPMQKRASFKMGCGEGADPKNAGGEALPMTLDRRGGDVCSLSGSLPIRAMLAEVIALLWKTKKAASLTEFAGRKNQEMLPHFRSNVIERTDELRWMPEL